MLAGLLLPLDRGRLPPSDQTPARDEKERSLGWLLHLGEAKASEESSAAVVGMSRVVGRPALI
jgi:hypothetical protein